VTLPEHAAEAADALRVAAAVVALGAQRHAHTEVAVAGPATPTRPVVVAHRLGERENGRVAFKNFMCIKATISTFVERQQYITVVHKDKYRTGLKHS